MAAPNLLRHGISTRGVADPGGDLRASGGGHGVLAVVRGRSPMVVEVLWKLRQRGFLSVSLRAMVLGESVGTCWILAGCHLFDLHEHD